MPFVAAISSVAAMDNFDGVVANAVGEINGLRFWSIATGTTSASLIMSAFEASVTPGGADMMPAGTLVNSVGWTNPENLFDGNPGTEGGRLTQPDLAIGWIGRTFATPRTLAEIRLRSGSSGGNAPIAFIVHATKDGGTTWFPIQIYFPSAWAANETKTFSVPAIRAVTGTARADARFWRWSVVAPLVSGSLARLAEIEMRATIGGPDQCSGGAAFASSFDGGDNIPRLTDNNLTTNLQGTSANLRAGYAFPAKTNVGQAMIHASTFGGPRFLTLDWSVDFFTWTTALSPPDQVTWPDNTTRLFTVP